MTHLRFYSRGRFRNYRRTFISSLKHPAWLSSLFVTALVLAIRQLGGFQQLELLMYDRMTGLKPGIDKDPRLLIVEITEDDIRKQQRWPLSDKTVAEMLAELQRHQPIAIGLDLYRDIPQEPGHADLQKQLKASNVVVVDHLGSQGNESVPAPAGIPPERVGFSDFVLDPDSVIRRNLLYASSKSEKFYSFALQLSRIYFAKEEKKLQIETEYLQLGDTKFLPINSSAGGYQGLDDRGYQILLNYRSATDIADRISLTQVLNRQFNPAWVTNRIVLIGTTAPSLKDLFPTPYSFAAKDSPKTPGVMVHAQMTSQILSSVLDGRPQIWFWSEWLESLWILGWSAVGALIVWRFRHPLLMGGVALAAIGGLGGVCFYLFTEAGWVPLVPAAVAMVGAGAGVVIYRLLHDAFHDLLTGLPNRALFIKQLQWAIEESRKALKPHHPVDDEPAIAVLLLGLDSFKTINDSFGHRLGDQLLVETTQRLRRCLHPHDKLARVGGDEFAILRRSVVDASGVTHLADQLQRQVTQPFHLDGQEIFTTASVGIVLNRPNSNCEPEEILRDAHTAMNQAKASGKARHEVFVTGMRLQVMTRVQLETDLRHALERQEFQLYYQPLIGLQTGKIAGFEALVRWRHDERGFVSPVDFIPVAEETNLILPLGEWILREACRQLRVWQSDFPKKPPLIVSVNLSAKQFSQPDLLEQVERALDDFELAEGSLKLEITESIAMTDVEATIALLQRLKALNLQLSIDDFGTGYSSLSYLHRFPTNTIKVDRSFVSRMGYESEDAHIVQTIIMLGHNLQMDIVAEGVETAEQLARLRTLGCEYAQGYYFAKPLSVEAIEALLKTDPTW